MTGVRGLALTAAPGWSIRVRLQSETQGRRNVVLHAATVPLPDDRGDFGSGVVTTLGSDDVFLSLFEYDLSSTYNELFSARGVPRVAPSDFSPSGMQRPLPGQSGGQWFFTAAHRPWTLHVVLGNHARRVSGALRVNALLSTLTIGAP